MLALLLSLGDMASARADVDASSKAAAETLFKDGRRLMSAERYAEACPKLAESQRLDPAAGTLMNLADCFEKNGQTASAWVTFTEAARAADARKRSDWKATAEGRVRALEPLLSMLAIEVDGATAKLDPVVVRDAAPVGRAQWGMPIPTDPGAHVVEVTVKGYEPFHARVVVAAQRDRAVIRVPALRPLAQPPGGAQPAQVSSSPAPAPAEPTSARRPIAIGALVAGGAALGVGVVFGVLAAGQASTADDLCPRSPCADRRGLDANDKAHTFATVSTIGFIASGALAAGGITLLLLPAASPAPASATAKAARFVVGPTGASFVTSF